MEIAEVMEMAFEEMWLNGLEDSIFRLNDLTRNFNAKNLEKCQVTNIVGHCYHHIPPPFTEAIIELDEQFVLLNEPFYVRDVLRHEIAHALCGPGHGHNEYFERMYMSIGGVGDLIVDPHIIRPKPKPFESVFLEGKRKLPEFDVLHYWGIEG